MPCRSTCGPDHEPGHVGEEQQRDVERIAQPDEPGRLVGGIDEQHAAEMARLGGHDADRLAVEPGERRDHLGSEQLLDLKQAVVVDDPVEEVDHVVALRRVLGQHRAGIGAGSVSSAAYVGRHAPCSDPAMYEK